MGAREARYVADVQLGIGVPLDDRRESSHAEDYADSGISSSSCITV
jgi:hypothetical protein